MGTAQLVKSISPSGLFTLCFLWPLETIWKEAAERVRKGSKSKLILL